MVKRYRAFALLMLLSGLQAITVLAEDTNAERYQLWQESSKWAIYVDTKVGSGCFIEHLTDDGTQIRLGYLPERLGGFLSVANPDWSDLEPGVIQDISLFFDGATFAGKTEYFEETGYFGGFSFFNNPNFLADFAKRKSLTIVDPDGEKTLVDLTGTSRAIAAMDACQEAQ